MSTSLLISPFTLAIYTSPKFSFKCGYSVLVTQEAWYLVLVLVSSWGSWFLARTRDPRTGLVPSLFISWSGTEAHTGVYFISAGRIRAAKFLDTKSEHKKDISDGDIHILNLITFCYIETLSSTCASAQYTLCLF